mgnify:CR=1 FL=1
MLKRGPGRCLNFWLVLLGDRCYFVALGKIVAMCKTLLAALFLTVLAVNRSNAQMYVKVIRANDTVPVNGVIPLKYEGKVEECYEYKDAAGLHLFLATSTADGKNFFGTCYSQVNGTYVQDWQIKDYSSESVDMADDYTKIVDIDHDGIYENIFIYTYWTAKNKFVGATWKLMLHYKNKKYAVRAYEPDSDDDEPDLTMDKSFDELPKAVKAYVRHYWDALAKGVAKVHEEMHHGKS